MIEVYKSSARGSADHGWLQAKHSFSFGQYQNPERMGVGPLVVINEDRIAPSKGFGMHGHEDMEIITYIIKGALAHKDSMGNGSVIKPGDVQRMSAGSGVRHSEFNASDTETTHLLQIWIKPNVIGIVPSYEEKQINAQSKLSQLALIASPRGKDGAVLIHQAAYIYASMMQAEDQLSHALAANRIAYVHVIRGEVSVCGEALSTGDALRIETVELITLNEANDAELLLFDLPNV